MASDSRRVLITGASGLLGRALMKAFSSSLNWQVLGLAHTRVSGNLQKVNLLDFEETRRIVEEFKPHLLVHSAAERRPDIVEKNPDATQNLNVGTTEFLAKLVEDFNKGLKSPSHFMLYISTDYVFDGTSAVPYKPDDPPHPINKYGQSKLEGEQAVVRYHPNGLILRVPVLYGDVEHLGESSVSVLLSSLKDTKKSSIIDDYHLRYPTLVDDVAKVVLFMANEKNESPMLCGIFHWSSDEQMTKYAMTTKMAKLFGLSMDHLKPNQSPPSGPTVRPYNSALHCGKLEDLMGAKKLDYRTSFVDGAMKYLKPFV